MPELTIETCSKLTTETLDQGVSIVYNLDGWRYLASI